MAPTRVRGRGARKRRRDAARRHGTGSSAPLRGFTLLELVAVMVVLGVMAGTAALALRTTGRNRVMAGAKQLLRDITYARQRATATGTRTWLEFTATDPVYAWSLYVEDPLAPGRAGASSLTDAATGSPFVQHVNDDRFVGVKFAHSLPGGTDWLGFDWLGRPLDQSGETTPLSSDATITFGVGGPVITVDQETGHAALSP